MRPNIGSGVERAGAVGDLVFYLGGQLGERLVVAVRHEERVVAEALIAAQFLDNPTLYRPLDG